MSETETDRTTAWWLALSGVIGTSFGAIDVLLDRAFETLKVAVRAGNHAAAVEALDCMSELLKVQESAQKAEKPVGVIKEKLPKEGTEL